MRYLLRFSVLLLSALLITGCHHRRKAPLPPPQAEAPIITKLPPMPPLTFPNVQIEKPKPVIPLIPTPVAEPTQEKAPTHHRRVQRRKEPVPAEPTPAEDEVKGTAVLGQLSTEDPTASPHQDETTRQLIESTEDRFKKVPASERAQHKEALTQIESFLSQARQAWSMNDMVGAQTLANKAKIMLDELLK